MVVPSDVIIQDYFTFRKRVYLLLQEILIKDIRHGNKFEELKRKYQKTINQSE